MIEDFEEVFPKNLISKPFENADEYLKYELKKISRHVNYYLDAKRNKNYSRTSAMASSDFYNAEYFIKSRLDLSDKNLFISNYIIDTFNINLLEWFCILLGVLINTDEKYKEMIRSIDNEKTITYSMALKLYFFVENACDIEGYYGLWNNLTKKMNSLFFNGDMCKFDEYVFQNIVQNKKELIVERGGIKIRFPNDSGTLDIREDIAKGICKYLKSTTKNHTAYYYIEGCEGIGKKSIVNRACDILNKNLVYFDFKDYISNDKQKFTESMMCAYRQALMCSGYLCLDNFQALINEDSISKKYIEFILNSASNFSKAVFILSSQEVLFGQYLKDCIFMDVKLEDLKNEEKFKIWSKSLKGLKTDKDLDVHELANKFSFTPLQINNTINDAKKMSKWKYNRPIDKLMICEAAYNQVSGNLSDKATLIRKKHTWDELVLQKDQKEILKRACNHIKYKHVVYDEWGMGKRVLYGRGLSVLFAGPPGTGKTMAAQVIANELGLEIYKVDLSKVISKYIGETEKNLGEVFESAKKSNVILLFDETDALFGKRTEVKDSHDKNANVETSYLLQKMEEYDGITIMTTNFLENIDKAFFRRITYVVHFTFPDVASRKEIWKKMYTKGIPLSKDIDFDYLSKRFEIAGGSIKNVVINSSFMAAAESNKVEMKHILRALEYEIKKQGKIVSKTDFGEYAYLI